MNQDVFEVQVTKLLQLHAPVKARQLATILKDEFGQHVDRSVINSLLYRLRTEGKAEVDAAYRWSLLGASPQKDGSAKTNVEPMPTAPAQPTITFTDEQQAVIDLDPSQHLLVRGQAGSGKTTVLAARAGRLLSAMNKGSLLFLTYNSALCAYVKKAFSQAGMKGSVDVRTFHDWSRSTAKDMGLEFVGWVDGKTRSEQLKRLIKEAEEEIGSHRFFELKEAPQLLGWWGEEIAWLFGQHVTRLDD